MEIVSILILVVFVVSALLLMVVVLIQDDQGGGIGGMFGGGGGTPFGARTGNVMTRLTAVLAVIFLVAAFVLAWMNRSPDAGNVIGRSRAERLRGIERTDWWVQTPAPAAAYRGGSGGRRRAGSGNRRRWWDSACRSRRGGGAERRPRGRRGTG